LKPSPKSNPLSQEPLHERQRRLFFVLVLCFLYFLYLLYLLYILCLMTLPSRLRWLWLTLAVVLLDRASKAWFESQTTEGWRRELIHNFVYLVHSRNPGLAFGIFSDSASPGTRIILILGSISIITVLAWLLVTSQSGNAAAVAGLALLLGGATGNVTDRILHGAVTDFFEVWFGAYRYPAFNVADSAIAIGAVLILLDILFGRRPEAPRSSSRTP
jgi:signal peptidase II